MMWMLYIGFMVFGLNGIMWAAQRQQSVMLNEREARIRQLLVRSRLRGRR